VVGKKFAGTTDCTEQWYGTEYSCTKISDDLLQVVCTTFVFMYKIV